MSKYNNNNSVRLIYFEYSIFNKNRIYIKEIGKKYFYFKKIELIFVWIVPPLIDRYLPKKWRALLKVIHSQSSSQYPSRLSRADRPIKGTCEQPTWKRSITVSVKNPSSKFAREACKRYRNWVWRETKNFMDDRWA